MHRPPDSASRVLRENRSRYGDLVDVVRRYAGEGDPERVLRAATLAANYAWRSPVGILADPALERLVVGSVRGPGRTEVDGSRDSGRVLHVLTEAYELGGHTRLAWRWIARDRRRSDVVLTNQHTEGVPPALRAVVAESGGSVHDLRSTSGDFVTRARALRILMDQADLVVQHVHPYDAVALAAANLPGPRPPVIYENHAEHTYWLGLGSADLVSDYHAFSQQVSRGLRGVRPDRLGLLPIPLEEVAGPTPRDEVRKRMNLRPDTVVGVTVASAHKISPMWGRGMSKLLDRALTWCPQLTVVLVGTPDAGEWARLAARYRGRVFPLGPVPDAEPFYAAADIYLDSYPSRSGTSVLEAALHGLPVLNLADLDASHGYAQLYQADSPGMTTNPRATGQEQYVTMLKALVNDPQLRAERGATVRSAVQQAHTGGAWVRSMEALYAKARTVPVSDLDEFGDGVVDTAYGSMLLGYMGAAQASPDVATAIGVLGEQLETRLQADVFAISNRERGPSLSVRISAGWEADHAWTSRLLALAGAHPRLAVSLPFAAGDDAQGSRTTAVLEALLAGLGSTLADCGDISVDSTAPRSTGPSVSGELPLVAEALDWLEVLASSPSWEPLTRSALEGEPVSLRT